VECIKLSNLIRDLNERIKLIKIDVECHEDIVLRELIEADILSQVDQILVEVHDKKYPFMSERINSLRNLINDRGLEQKIDLTWH
jgi:hypothetical protein